MSGMGENLWCWIAVFSKLFKWLEVVHEIQLFHSTVTSTVLAVVLIIVLGTGSQNCGEIW